MAPAPGACLAGFRRMLSSAPALGDAPPLGGGYGGAMLQHIKYGLLKIGAGLLYGIGIGISMTAITWYMTESMTASFMNEGALENVVITKHEEVTRDGALYVLGTVENRAAESVRVVNVQVDLFDKDGKFVDQCSEYLKGTLKAGESRNFKVSCRGCKQRPAVAHASYKVKVNGM